MYIDLKGSGYESDNLGNEDPVLDTPIVLSHA
jgi:hypothetical protein